MPNKDAHIKDILNYLDNKMTERDAYVFERRMEADPFLMDAVEGYQNMSPSEIEKELLTLHARLNQKNKTRIVPIWMRTAAAVLILLGIGTLWMIDQRKQKQDLVSDRIEVQDEKVQRHVQSVLSMEKQSEKIDVAENNDEIQELKELTNVQHIAAVPRAEQPVANKGSSSRKLYVNNKLLKNTDSMSFMEEETGNYLANVDVSAVEKDEIDGPKPMMIRGTSPVPNDTLLVLFKGRVVDENGIPLPGVRVTHSILGGLRSEALADNSAISDMDGNFTIKDPQKGAVLQLSSIGFKDRIDVVKNDSLGELVMEPAQMAMDEVVVVGYGIQRKKQITGSITVAKESNLKVESEDNILLPEPKEGVKKLVRKIERSLIYHDIPKGEKLSVIVELSVSSKGEVLKVQTEPQLSADFMLQLEEKLKASQWIAPKINGTSIESSRKLAFEFMGE